MSDFIPFPKIPRLSRDCIITEKIDGTNAQVYISDDLSEIRFGSRNRWITPTDDNYGFARWGTENQAELMKLGLGRHFGEWWGQGINRGYGLTEKRFSLFNVTRWNDPATRPACCGVVPLLSTGTFSEDDIELCLTNLVLRGSVAAPGFMKPEGIVLLHTRANQLFKKLIENDHIAKGEVA